MPQASDRGNWTASKSEPHREPLYRQGLLGAAFEAKVPVQHIGPLLLLLGFITLHVDGDCVMQFQGKYSA